MSGIKTQQEGDSKPQLQVFDYLRNKDSAEEFRMLLDQSSDQQLIEPRIAPNPVSPELQPLVSKRISENSSAFASQQEHQTSRFRQQDSLTFNSIKTDGSSNVNMGNVINQNSSI